MQRSTSAPVQNRHYFQYLQQWKRHQRMAPQLRYSHSTGQDLYVPPRRVSSFENAQHRYNRRVVSPASQANFSWPTCTEQQPTDDSTSNASLNDPAATNESNPIIGAIEIAPGEYRSVLGADYSRRAMENHTFVRAMCWECDQVICNVPEAAYVICPLCRTVNPTDDRQPAVIGLGFLLPDVSSSEPPIQSGSPTMLTGRDAHSN